MKTSAQENGNYCGLIGLAMAFLFAAVPISIEVAAADGSRHLAADQGMEGCGVFKVQDRQATADSFSLRVAAVRKQLGAESR